MQMMIKYLVLGQWKNKILHYVFREGAAIYPFRGQKYTGDSSSSKSGPGAKRQRTDEPSSDSGT